MPDFGAFCAFTLWGLFACFFGGIHPESAFGAIGGSFFFMTLPQTVKGWRSIALWLTSLSMAYGTGIVIARNTEWAAWAFIAAVMVGALGSTLLTAIAKYIDGGPLPDFLERILDAIPFLNKKRGSSDA
jgi:hypothetical protein